MRVAGELDRGAEEDVERVAGELFKRDLAVEVARFHAVVTAVVVVLALHFQGIPFDFAAVVLWVAPEYPDAAAFDVALGPGCLGLPADPLLGAGPL